MNKGSKLLAASVLALSMAFTPLVASMPLTSAASAQQQAEITVQLDGEVMALSPAPVVEKGVTLVPMRPIFNALGARITWHQETQTIFAQGLYQTVTLQVGARQAVVNAKTVQLDAPARVVNGTTMVPLRFVAEAMNAKVRWDGPTRTVVIETRYYSAAAGDEQAYDDEWYYEEELLFSVEEIVSTQDEKVVMIQTDVSQGSGVVIGEDWILTNYHVVKDASEAEALFLYGETLAIAGIIAYDEDTDLAILQTVEVMDIEPVEIGPSSFLLNKGEQVVAIGSPYGLQNTVSAGLISNTVVQEGWGYFQINAPIDSGSSGGALFNMKGQLIGITTAGVPGSSASLNFAVGTQYITWLISDAIQAIAEEAPVTFAGSSLPASLKGLSADELQAVMKENFSIISSELGTTELSSWKVTREASGWLVMEAKLDSRFYMFYAEDLQPALRLWAVDAIYKLQNRLADERFELVLYYEQTFNYEPRGFAPSEVTRLSNEQWKVRYTVLQAQSGDRAHIAIR